MSKSCLKVVIFRYFASNIGATLTRSNLDPRVQRKLLPYHENFLVLPSPSRVHQLKVELPKKVG